MEWYLHFAYVLHSNNYVEKRFELVDTCWSIKSIRLGLRNIFYHTLQIKIRRKQRFFCGIERYSQFTVFHKETFKTLHEFVKRCLNLGILSSHPQTEHNAVFFELINKKWHLQLFSISTRMKITKYQCDHIMFSNKIQRRETNFLEFIHNVHQHFSL